MPSTTLTARGNARAAVFLKDDDRNRFLTLLRHTAARRRCHAYRLTGNHDHLVLTTPEPNHGCGRRDLDGGCAQAFDRRHGRPESPSRVATTRPWSSATPRGTRPARAGPR